MFTTVIGALAAILTTICFIPQAVKIMRSRHTKDLSLGMYLLFTIGVACWLVYGILTMQWNIILCNAVTVVLASTILVMKIRFG